MRTEAVRTATLPQGRELVVRPVQRDDCERLQALYEGLDDESRYRRFFSMYHPAPSYFERLVSVGERGGAGLVACIQSTGPDGSISAEELIGEASYELLANGDGEFSITIARSWRGWLGPYVLDALLELAGSRGVLNLEAYVLATNTPMLALARSRGYVGIPDDDFCTLHISLATCPCGPRWPPQRAAFRLLIEGRGVHSTASVAAAGAGLEVRQCSGPSMRGRRCPVLGGGQCPLASGADAIVLNDPDDTVEWEAIRASHQQLGHHPPVWVASHRRVPLRPDETPLVSSPGGLADFFACLRDGERE